MASEQLAPLSRERVEEILGQETLDLVDTIAGSVAALRIKVGTPITANLLRGLLKTLEA